MCGICGFIGQRDTPRLTAMMAVLRHRGPDDQGSFESGLVSLGSTRLAIVDVAQGRQPMASEDGSVVAAREVADRFGTEHHEYVMSHQELVEGLSAVLRAFDQPFSGVMSPYFLNKLVSQHVKVCLSGDGADEQFGSYLAHRLAQPIHQVLLHGEEAVRRQPELGLHLETTLIG